MTRPSNIAAAAPLLLSVTLLTGVALTQLAAPPSAAAIPDYADAFAARYPASTLLEDTQTAAGSTCFLCHNPSQFLGDLNCYRRDLITRLRPPFSRTIHQALADIENLDSDNDGFSNLVEILSPRPASGPGPIQIGFNPGLVGRLGNDPCYALSPTQPQTFRSETPGINPCSLADITGIGGPPSFSDGLLTGDDFLTFTNAFAADDPLADLCGIGGPPTPPDGLITGDDFVAFVGEFATGCP